MYVYFSTFGEEGKAYVIESVYFFLVLFVCHVDTLKS